MGKSTLFIFSISFVLLLNSCGNENNNDTDITTRGDIKERAAPLVEKKQPKSKEKTTKVEPEALSVPPQQLEKSKEIIRGVNEKNVLTVEAERLYKISCSTCHGTKGNLLANGAKDLTKSKISLEESVAQIYFGKGMMLPYSDALSETEIVALAKYVEGLRK